MQDTEVPTGVLSRYETATWILPMIRDDEWVNSLEQRMRSRTRGFWSPITQASKVRSTDEGWIHTLGSRDSQYKGRSRGFSASDEAQGR